MSKLKAKIKFDDYVDMVRNRAHYYARCFHIDYEDVEAEGFCIYCLTINNFNKKKASFSTYLYQNLSGYLLAYCKRKMEKEHLDSSLDELLIPKLMRNSGAIDADLDFDIFPAREGGPTKEQLLSYAECYLSTNAFNILKWILNEGLTGFRSKTCPSFNSISQRLSIDLLTLKLAWQELTDFWNWRGAAFYASI